MSVWEGIEAVDCDGQVDSTIPTNIKVRMMYLYMHH